MARLNHLGTDKLRRGRVSIAGARYFLTLTTEERMTGLTESENGNALIDAFRLLHREGDIEFRCLTLMPDHLHVLFVLGQRLSLSQIVGKYKGLTKVALLRYNLEWQANFFDRRLRFADASEAFARYIFMNPYRKQLISMTETWPWWILSRKYQPEFIHALTPDGCPQSEWLGVEPTLKDLLELDKSKD